MLCDSCFVVCLMLKIDYSFLRYTIERYLQKNSIFFNFQNQFELYCVHPLKCNEISNVEKLAMLPRFRDCKRLSVNSYWSLSIGKFLIFLLDKFLFLTSQVLT